MVQSQTSTLVGGHQIVDENLPDDQEDGKSPLSDNTFTASKDRYSLETAISKIFWLLGGVYTSDYVNSLTSNDLLYEVRMNADAIEAASASASARSADTNYDRGERATSGGQTWQATNDGTTASGTAPAGPGSIGGTVVDGTVTWVRTA